MPHTNSWIWTSLPATRPFVLPEDATAISAFNLRAHEKKRYDLTLFRSCTSDTRSPESSSSR